MIQYVSKGNPVSWMEVELLDPSNGASWKNGAGELGIQRTVYILHLRGGTKLEALYGLCLQQIFKDPGNSLRCLTLAQRESE